jgi:hypothetical protein
MRGLAGSFLEGDGMNAPTIGPIATHVMRITNIHGDDARPQHERDYTADIAELLGANVTASVRASVLDTLCTAGV